MTETQTFRHPIGRLKQWRRKLYCQAMATLGYPHFVVRAQGALFLVGTEDLIDRSIASSKSGKVPSSTIWRASAGRTRSILSSISGRIPASTA